MHRDYGKYGGVKVVAEMIGRTEKATRRLWEKGKLPAPARVDARLTWDLRDIEKWMQAGKESQTRTTAAPLDAHWN